MNIESVARNFTQALATDGGLHPTPGAVADGDNQALFALAMSAEEVVDLGFNLCRDVKVKEFWLSFDCHNEKSPLDPFHNSTLIIFHVCKGDTIRLGAMPYGWLADSPIVGEVEWDDPFWFTKYETLLNHLARQCRGPAVTIGIEPETECPVRLN
jgi:hypothetical protein